MDLFEAILNRRSIRKYSAKEVNNEQLEEIIKFGMYSPSAVNKQPWHFIIFRDNNIIDRLSDVHPNASMLKSASAGILICFDEKLQHDIGYGPIDCSAATQNMLLAAHGMGLGACWIGIYPRQNRIDALRQVLSIPEHVTPFAVISVGYPDQTRTRPVRFKKERIHYDTW